MQHNYVSTHTHTHTHTHYADLTQKAGAREGVVANFSHAGPPPSKQVVHYLHTLRCSLRVCPVYNAQFCTKHSLSQLAKNQQGWIHIIWRGHPPRH